jgi:hypothetical protein
MLPRGAPWRAGLVESDGLSAGRGLAGRMGCSHVGPLGARGSSSRMVFRRGAVWRGGWDAPTWGPLARGARRVGSEVVEGRKKCFSPKLRPRLQRPMLSVTPFAVWLYFSKTLFRVSAIWACLVTMRDSFKASTSMDVDLPLAAPF